MFNSKLLVYQWDSGILFRKLWGYHAYYNLLWMGYER